DDAHPATTNLLEQLVVAEATRQGRPGRGNGPLWQGDGRGRPGRPVVRRRYRRGASEDADDLHGGPELAQLVGKVGVLARGLLDLGRFAAALPLHQRLEQLGEAGVAVVGGRKGTGHGEGPSPGVSSSACNRRTARRQRIDADASLSPSAWATSWLDSCST